MAKPLKKRDRAGKPYKRPPNIEAKINEALTKDVSTLKQLALVDRQSPDYIPSECLVYFIRDAGRQGDHDTMNSLLQTLLTRCGGNLFRKVPDYKYPKADEIHEKVLAEFVDLFVVDLYGDKNDELDFYECRFNYAFRALRIDVLRSEAGYIEHAANLLSLDDNKEHIGDEGNLFLQEALRSIETIENRIALRELLEALPLEERRAVVLRHIMGYKVESEDPLEETAATRCGVSGRTIRIRLSRASAMLSKFKEGK